MYKPNLKALRTFQAAATHLNFRLAAEELHITRGAVAQQIRKLEDDLGVTLFYRLPRGLALTQRGKEYFLSIQEAFRLIDNATQSCIASSQYVTLSMTPSFASKWLLPRLPQFEASHPDIDLRIEVNETLANLETNPADIFIHYGHSQEQSSLFNEQLIDTQLLAVCSLSYARKHCVQYAVDGSQSTFHIETPSACTISHLIQDQHKYWENWFNQTQLKSKEKMLIFNQTSLAIDAAINGQGITLVRDILVQQHLKQGELITLCSLPSSVEEGYYLSYSAQKIQQQSNIAIVKAWLENQLSIKNQNISNI